MIRSRKSITPDNALQRLEDLCARSEQCSGEARKKLYNWGITAKDTEQIVSSLIERRFIDDRRYCRAYVRDKLMFSHWGKRKIKLSLIQKRIDREIIDYELEQIDIDSYTDILKKIVLAKAGTIDGADSYEGRTRLFRFAVSRGFEPDLISKIIRDMAKHVR